MEAKASVIEMEQIHNSLSLESPLHSDIRCFSKFSNDSVYSDPKSTTSTEHPGIYPSAPQMAHSEPWRYSVARCSHPSSPHLVLYAFIGRLLRDMCRYRGGAGFPALWEGYSPNQDRDYRIVI